MARRSQCPCQEPLPIRPRRLKAQASDAGASFARPIDVEVDAVGYPEVALLDDGTALVSWRGRAGEDEALRLARVAPDGTMRRHGAVYQGGFPNWPSKYPGLAGIGNQAFLAWTDPIAKRVRMAVAAGSGYFSQANVEACENQGIKPLKDARFGGSPCRALGVALCRERGPNGRPWFTISAHRASSHRTLRWKPSSAPFCARTTAAWDVSPISPITSVWIEQYSGQVPAVRDPRQFTGGKRF
ncbi:MAG: hypothetical protein EPN21_20220 [Methylococcaceae bacterium]|nr:MAG: hypothetical protein EPN21_20220 [Methylococcaceae bacterium]